LKLRGYSEKEAMMPVPMKCPNPACGKQGNLPDTFPGGKVMCPACGTINYIPAPGSARPASTVQASTAPRPKPAAAAPRPAPKRSSQELDALGLDDADAGPPLVAPPLTRGRSQQPQPSSSGSSTALIAIIGGGAAAALLIIVLIVVVMQSGGTPKAPTAPDPTLVADNQLPIAPNPPPRTSQPDPAPAPYTPYVPPSNESPEATIQRIKEATVYVKVKIGKLEGTGTGFVITSQGNQAVIATNRHVVLIHLEGDDEEIADIKKGEQPRVSVVFRSGEGAGQEQEVPADLAAVDLTPGHGHDLAILVANGVRNVPKPIEVLHRAEPALGMDSRIYGFPFGKMLNVAAKGNPAITINKGAVSSLRRNDAGGLELLQIDGSVNPGNSGGPIVDNKGNLIGITVAKLAAVDNIGLAIPAAQLARMLDGTVGGARMAAKSVTDSQAEFDVEAFLSDPLNRLRTVSILIAPAAAQPANATGPGPDGSYPMLKSATSVTLSMDRTKNRATGKIQTPLAGANNRKLMVQFSCIDTRNRTFSTLPVSYEVPPTPGPMLALGRVANIETRLQKTLGRLGPLIDPDKDCKDKRDGRTLSISLPADKLHMLSPDTQFKDKKNQPLRNAPMVLTPVQGDFLLHVNVAGEILPGNEPCRKPTGGRMPFCIQGAGILLWQDKDNYLRLERSCGTAGGATLVHRLILEICQNGRVNRGNYAYVDVQEGSLHVMLMRTKGHMRCLWSSNGRKWVAFKELAVVFPQKIQLGLSAFNTSKLPFTAEFEEFALIEDPAKFAEELQEEEK
jgi:S1-C subfamily serine protease